MEWNAMNNHVLNAQLQEIRNSLKIAQGKLAELNTRPMIEAHDSILAAYKAQQFIAEAMRLIGLIEASG